jgi:hypothetical protein
MSQLGKFPSLNAAIEFVAGNIGGPVNGAAGIINIVGAGGVTVTGNPVTHTLTITAPAIPVGMVNTLTGNVGGAVGPLAGNINVVGGGGVTVTGNPATNTLTITGGAAGFTWNQVAGNAVNPAVINNGYILQNAGLTTITLPAAAPYGSTIKIIGEGAGGWTIVHPVAGHYIQHGNLATTPNTGSLSSTHRYNTVEITCRVVDTTWHVFSSSGILDVL